MNTSAFSDVRPSPIAGTWYPGDPEKLHAMIGNFLDRAVAPELDGELIALIVPHAGLIYSGFTAAHAFKCIRDTIFRRVIVLSPSHQPYPYPLLVSAHQAYETPLGQVPLDKVGLTRLNQLLDQHGITLTPIRQDREHSLEIELPFLQVVLPGGFELIPIMVMDQSMQMAATLANTLATYLHEKAAEKTLLVASSDLSHFYTDKQADQLDNRVLKAMEAMDASALYRLNASGTGQACGLGAIATVLMTSSQLGANHLTITDHRTSAAVTHDTESVVGYGSAVITRPT